MSSTKWLPFCIALKKSLVPKGTSWHICCFTDIGVKGKRSTDTSHHITLHTAKCLYISWSVFYDTPGWTTETSNKTPHFCCSTQCEKVTTRLQYAFITLYINNYGIRMKTRLRAWSISTLYTFHGNTTDQWWISTQGISNVDLWWFLLLCLNKWLKTYSTCCCLWRHDAHSTILIHSLSIRGHYIYL